jgi:hypothetical protein
VPASLVYPGQGRLPMKTRAFIDFAVGRIRERLALLETAAPLTSDTSSARTSSLVPVTPVQRRHRRLQR